MRSQCMQDVFLFVPFSADILKANDEVMKVMTLYEQIINKQDTSNLLIDAAEGSGWRKSCFKTASNFFSACFIHVFSIF